MTEAAVEVVVDLVWEHRIAAPRLPVSWLSDEEKAVELQRVQQRRAADAAYEAELIMGLAAARPATDDPAPGTPGARRPGWAVDEAYGGTSEFFTAELSAVLNVGRGTAAHRYDRAYTWLTKLPLTFAALVADQLDERRAAALAEVLQHTNPTVAGQVEAALLPEASDLPVTRLKARATEEMLRLDATAADERRKEAEKTADVQVYPGAVEGRATIAADLPTEEAVECFDVVDQLARMLKADGDPRRIGALSAAVLSLLVRRPADSGLPPVTANVTVSAGLDALEGRSSTPGEVSGLPITARHLRELLARVGALGLTAPEGGSLGFAVTGPDGQLLATLTPAELTRLARR
ncbi:HNH endonuclease, partial [Modestobacter excelsi]|uniref:HNH endonuclease n=1 Tax=Modestobacter excelsi TaxID=2213161 RepID=UPI00110C9128